MLPVSEIDRYSFLIHSGYVFVRPCCQSSVWDKFAKPFERFSGRYIWYFMSTQADDVIEEGVEGFDDALINSLIDAVHFDDLV